MFFKENVLDDSKPFVGTLLLEFPETVAKFDKLPLLCYVDPDLFGRFFQMMGTSVDSVQRFGFT